MSIWDIKLNRDIKELDNNKEVDILIIGGGITGLTSAYYLKDNKSMCVVEANKVGYGVTRNSTAKINYFQGTTYSKIATSTNVYNAIKYLEAEKFAINEIKNIIEKEKLECDLKKVPSYVFANTHSEIKVLNNEAKFLKKNNVDIVEKKLPINTQSFKSYCVNDTYIFNPLKYLDGLYNILNKENINIYENSKIIKIKKHNNKYVCYGEKYKITANKVVLATHYPFFLFPFMMPIRCSIEKSYIIVSKVEKDLNFTCITTNNPTYSVRYYNDGKNNYQISLSKSSELNKNQNDLYYFDRVKDIFNINDKDIVMNYTNSDIITPDYMPYIGELKKNMYIGVGYNTWGMSNGVLAAKIISDNILGKDNKFKEIFKPNRINSKIIVSIPYYIFNNAKSFINSKLYKRKKWYSNVKFYKENGKSIASYLDKDGMEHIVYNKCPHLGCSLIFNETELTWDCPCHSSRFSIDGKCIKGPSNYDISVK